MVYCNNCIALVLVQKFENLSSNCSQELLSSNCYEHWCNYLRLSWHRSAIWKCTLYTGKQRPVRWTKLELPFSYLYFLIVCTIKGVHFLLMRATYMHRRVFVPHCSFGEDYIWRQICMRSSWRYDDQFIQVEKYMQRNIWFSKVMNGCTEFVKIAKWRCSTVLFFLTCPVQCKNFIYVVSKTCISKTWSVQRNCSSMREKSRNAHLEEHYSISERNIILFENQFSFQYNKRLQMWFLPIKMTSFLLISFMSSFHQMLKFRIYAGLWLYIQAPFPTVSAARKFIILNIKSFCSYGILKNFFKLVRE